MGEGESGNPWAWAGLLKWSLNYTDGTADHSEFSPMSDEDKAFLEKVMREGLVDEAERMKFILTEATKAMESYQAADTNKDAVIEPPIQEEELEELLQELRDIVEQIDYARAFCSLQGIPFLLGCIQQPAVPASIRMASLGILSTIGQNNPPVQHQLLELGAIKSLCDLFYHPTSTEKLKAKIMQSISSIVRNHEVAEKVFANLPQAPTLMLDGLSTSSSVSPSLRSKTLFFLRALVTSDFATSATIQTFQEPIIVIRDAYLDETVDIELREMAIALLNQLLVDKKGGVRILLQRKNELAALGVQRIASLRKLTGEEQEFAQMELEHWENFLVLLARAVPEQESNTMGETDGKAHLLLETSSLQPAE